MPTMSKVRTPIRLLARPMRTSFLGRFSSSKNAFNAFESASQVPDLAVDDDACGERPPRELDELVPAVRLDDDGRSDLRGADLEAHDATALAAACRLALRALLALLSLREENRRFGARRVLEEEIVGVGHGSGADTATAAATGTGLTSSAARSSSRAPSSTASAGPRRRARRLVSSDRPR